MYVTRETLANSLQASDSWHNFAKSSTLLRHNSIAALRPFVQTSATARARLLVHVARWGANREQRVLLSLSFYPFVATTG